MEKAGRLINMDSQAPNQAAAEWLSAGGWERWRRCGKSGRMGIPASTFLSSRWTPVLFGGQGRDTGGRWGGSFPDAPTLRGTKHLLGLAQAAAAGYRAYVLFVIQMGNVKYFCPETGRTQLLARRFGKPQRLGCKFWPWTAL